MKNNHMINAINRDELIQELYEYKVDILPNLANQFEAMGYNDGIDLAITIISNTPLMNLSLETCKVERVNTQNPRNIVWRCENCGQYMHQTNWGRKTKYCSYCGSQIQW